MIAIGAIIAAGSFGIGFTDRAGINGSSDS